MTQTIAVSQTLTCKRCGKSWERRGKELPIRCPRCSSIKWQEEKQ